MQFEKVNHDTILRLKQAKERKGLSISKISDMLYAKGYSLSESTLKRVFSEKSEDFSFRYLDTIAPLADVLLDAYSEGTDLEDNKALKTIIEDKNQAIEFLFMQIEELKAQYQRSVAHLNTQISNMRKQLDKKDEMITKILNVCLNNTKRSDIFWQQQNNFRQDHGE